MKAQKEDLAVLKKYLPENCFEAVCQYLHLHAIQLTISRERDTILGNYRSPHAGSGHRISVNGNLNTYAFLITLLHEIAHLITFEKHQARVKAHGKEWQNAFGVILKQFLEKKIFPHDIEEAILKSIHKPAASTCGDKDLQRALAKYDRNINALYFVEDIKMGTNFLIKNGRTFSKGKKIRTRYLCVEVASQKAYLFSALHPVTPLETNK